MVCGVAVDYSSARLWLLLVVVACALPVHALFDGLGSHIVATSAHLLLVLVLCQRACACRMGMVAQDDRLDWSCYVVVCFWDKLLWLGSVCQCVPLLLT